VNGRAQGRHLRPVLSASRYAAWWWLLVIMAGANLVQLLASAGAAARSAGPAFLLVLLIVVLSELRPVVVSERSEGVSLSWAFLFASLLVWGLALTSLVLAVSLVVTGLVRRSRAHVVAFNVAQWSLSYAAAWRWLGRLGWQPLGERAEAFAPADLSAVLGAAVLWYVVNLVLVGVAVGLLERRAVLGAITDDLGYFISTTWGVLALAPVIVVLLERDWRFLPFLLVPLYMIHRVASIAHEREQRALRDDLTGLGNRAQFLHRYEELARSARGFAVCLLDLDRFKPINDTHGHAVGDEILRLLAGRLRAVLRPIDTAVRFGGDEFALLLDVGASEEVDRTLRRIVDHLTRPYEVDGLRLEVGVSYGLARSQEHGRELEELLRVADLMMYEAKRALAG
jgi:diguanylate cyclase (GGDEF)-like protein